MAEIKKTPQTPEEIAREAQAQAMKAALEQAQAMYGNIPGFESADLMKMHEKLMQDSAEMFPGVAEAQAYQAKMMAESAQDPEAIMETYSKNLEFAGNVMQQAMNAGFMPEGLPDFSDGFDVYAGWEITRKGDNSLTPEQNRLLAYGAPLFLYNDDNMDSLESTTDTDTLKEMLEEWWEVTDRKSALETISWLLNEGQHAGADPALAEIRQRGIEAITEEEKADEDSKIGDAFTIAEFVMGVNETTEADLPETVRGIIADCGFTSPKEILKTVLKRDYHLPAFPLMNLTELLTRWRAGFGYSDASTLDAMKNCRIPVLFIHGEKDSFVPVQMTLDNYMACRAPKELLIVPGAVHAAASLQDPEGYQRTALAFLKKYS